MTCFISENRILLGTSTMLSCRNFLRSFSGLWGDTAARSVDKVCTVYCVFMVISANCNNKVDKCWKKPSKILKKCKIKTSFEEMLQVNFKF